MFDKDTQSNDGSQWWKSKSKQDLSDNVFSFIKHLDSAQSYRSADNLKNARLYGNFQLMGLDAYSYSQTQTGNGIKNRITLNVVRSMVDTVVSKITKNKPRPTFLTEGGNWTLKKKAKNLTKFIDGSFNSTDFYVEGEKAFKDSCIFGTGAAKIFVKDGNIHSERIFIEELQIDDVESFYGKPRQIHQTKYLHKEVLVAMFPKHEVKIMSANNDDEKQRNNHQQKANNMVRVVESWHLPSSKEATDGRHTISISNQNLLDEEYTKSYFPFVFFKWNTRPIGFFGQGIAEQLSGLQLEINKILRTIQVSMHLVSVPKLLVEASSKIVTSHLNNKIGGIIKYAGQKPDSMILGSIPPELFNHLDRLLTRAYEIIGVSELSAQSSKPSGLDSGKALREFNDIETERFMSVGKNYEKAFMDAAEIMIDMSRDLYKDNKDLKVTVKGRKFIESISWKDVDMEEDKYMMDIFPTTALSRTPSGRLQDVQDLIAAGFIGQEEGLKLLDFPDLQGSMNMLNADSNNLELIVEQMMDKGKYVSPEPYQNLENGIRKVQQAYLMYKVDGAPDDRLELLRQWMEDAQGLILKSQQPSPQEMVQNLAAEGANQASAVVAEQGDVGADPNALADGGQLLGENEPSQPEIPEMASDVEIPEIQ